MIKALLAAIAIIAHEPGYYTSRARDLQRWLKGGEIAAQIATPKEMNAALAKSKVAFLLGFDEPTAAEMASLSAYVQGGGKLVVFHSSSAQLGRLMGVRPTGYKTAAYPGCWSRMDFVRNSPPGFPARILQTSTVLQSAEPIEGQGRVIAAWCDRKGRPTGDAAWIATRHGFWMTHVLLPDGDEELKAQLAAAICGSIDPKSWNAAEAAAKKAREHERLKRFALKQVPKKGEIHAVWDHSGCGLYPGDWPRTFKVLQEARVTDIFVNVAGAGFAHYNSNVLPKSQTFANEGDQLAACLKAAKGSGIRVHAWMLCFTATRGGRNIEVFRKRGWTLKTSEGAASEYLDPANAEVRKYLLGAIRELGAVKGLDGVHLDFVRWYECAEKPKTAARTITAFVSEARRTVPKSKWLTTAVLGKYPACVSSVGQDWTMWLDTGIVDYVVPMDYTEDLAKLDSFFMQHAESRKRAGKIIVGLGVTANESRLGPEGVIREINLSRKYPFAGVALFDLDLYLEKNIFPYLKLGIW